MVLFIVLAGYVAKERYVEWGVGKYLKHRFFSRILPFIFFIGVQPGTPVEKLLIEQGYLKKDYNPLSLNPFVIKKLLYNPKPLGRIIARSYLQAVDSLDSNSDYIGRATMELIEKELRKPDYQPGIRELVRQTAKVHQT